MTVRASYSVSLIKKVLFLYCLTENDMLLSIGTRALIRLNRHRMVKVDLENSGQSYTSAASNQSKLGRSDLSRRGSHQVLVKNERDGYCSSLTSSDPSMEVDGTHQPRPPISQGSAGRVPLRPGFLHV